MATNSPEIGEYTVSFTPDAEWLGLQTAPFNGEEFAKMQPVGNDFVNLDLPNARDLHRAHSEAGTFEMSAPKDRPFEDWSLVLCGLPRIIDKLNEPVIKQLFGRYSVALIKEAFRTTQQPGVGGDIVTLRLPHTNVASDTRRHRIEHSSTWQRVAGRGYIVPRSEIILDR